MAASKPQDITACPDWGKGGSYTLDPVTGIRTLVQRTEEAAAAEPAAAAPAETPAAEPTVKKGA